MLVLTGRGAIGPCRRQPGRGPRRRPRPGACNRAADRRTRRRTSRRRPKAPRAGAPGCPEAYVSPVPIKCRPCQGSTSSCNIVARPSQRASPDGACARSRPRPARPAARSARSSQHAVGLARVGGAKVDILRGVGHQAADAERVVAGRAPFGEAAIAALAKGVGPFLVVAGDRHQLAAETAAAKRECQAVLLGIVEIGAGRGPHEQRVLDRSNAERKVKRPARNSRASLANV